MGEAPLRLPGVPIARGWTPVLRRVDEDLTAELLRAVADLRVLRDDDALVRAALRFWWEGSHGLSDDAIIATIASILCVRVDELPFDVVASSLLPRVAASWAPTMRSRIVGARFHEAAARLAALHYEWSGPA